LRPSLLRLARGPGQRLGRARERLLDGLAAPDDIRHVVWLGPFARARLERLLYRQLDDLYRPAYERYREPATGTHLERVLGQDLALRLPHAQLALRDRVAMATSLAVQAPLLDVAVAEFVAALPMTMKLRRLTGNWILRQVARTLLPAELAAPRPQREPLAVAAWLRGPLQPLMRDALLDGASLATQGRCDRHAVEQLIDEHAEGRRDHAEPLWALLVLELWRRENLAIRSAADRRRASTR
jgi:asparagine synthase (glutamine-hydrolysing)